MALADSSVICHYLAEKHPELPPLYGSTPEQRATFSRDYEQWVLDGATGERYYLDDDLYDDLGFLLYYHD